LFFYVAYSIDKRLFTVFPTKSTRSFGNLDTTFNISDEHAELITFYWKNFEAIYPILVALFASRFCELAVFERNYKSKTWRFGKDA
jgi:hypothetical protein